MSGSAAESMSLYDYNKAMYQKSEDIDISNEEYRSIVKDFLENNPAKYYLFMSPSMHYCTMFVTGSGVGLDIVDEFISLLVDTFPVAKSLSWDGDMLHFWGTWDTSNEVDMFALFKYDGGVIECQ